MTTFLKTNRGGDTGWSPVQRWAIARQFPSVLLASSAPRQNHRTATRQSSRIGGDVSSVSAGGPGLSAVVGRLSLCLIALRVSLSCLLQTGKGRDHCQGESDVL